MPSDLCRTLYDAAEPQAPEAAQLPEDISCLKGILVGQYALRLLFCHLNVPAYIQL